MAKLSHIEDIELKRAQEALQQTKAQQAEAEPKPQVAQEMQAGLDEAKHDAQQETPSKPADGQAQMTAQQEADFHGIDTSKPMGIGHRFLVILAVLVTIAAILYIVNSWVHFI